MQLSRGFFRVLCRGLRNWTIMVACWPVVLGVGLCCLLPGQFQQFGSFVCTTAKKPIIF